MPREQRQKVCGPCTPLLPPNQLHVPTKPKPKPKKPLLFKPRTVRHALDLDLDLDLELELELSELRPLRPLEKSYLLQFESALQPLKYSSPPQS